MICCYLLTDIDECGTNSHDCHVSATCTNTDGSFTCACNLGYTGDGKVCSGAWVDIYTVFIYLIIPTALPVCIWLNRVVHLLLNSKLWSAPHQLLPKRIISAPPPPPHSINCSINVNPIIEQGGLHCASWGKLFGEEVKECRIPLEKTFLKDCHFLQPFSFKCKHHVLKTPQTFENLLTQTSQS